MPLLIYELTRLIDMAWLADMDNSPMEGGLLAAECGSGKTAIILLLILITHYRLVDENSQNHFATLIVAPSSVIDVWYADYVKFFGKALNCRIFYGQASNSDPEREKCFVGNNIKDFENELKLMSPNDPNVSLPSCENKSSADKIQRPLEHSSSLLIQHFQDEQ